MSEWNLVKTRAQKKAEKEGSKVSGGEGAKRNLTLAERRMEEDNKMIKMLKENAEEETGKWKKISEIEKALTVLNSLYKRAKKRDIKKDIRELTDKYEKQMKKLIISQAKKKKASNNKANERANEVESKQDNSDGDTIMSPITVKTTMSQKIQEKNSKVMNTGKSTESSKRSSNVHLESLGSTRSSKVEETKKSNRTTEKDTMRTNKNDTAKRSSDQNNENCYEL